MRFHKKTTMLINNKAADELFDYKKFAIANLDMTMERYARILLTPDLFVGTVEILTPKFLIYRGGIFFAEGFSETDFEKWFQKLDGEINVIEKMINHVHVRGMIQFGQGHSIAIIRHVAEVLRKFWFISLTDQFPNARFTIDIIDNIDEEDCTILIYQDKSPDDGNHRSR